METTFEPNQTSPGRVAIFPGSFDPFTIGHDSIVRRGLELFDLIVIAVGVNIRKPDAARVARENLEKIAEIYAGNPAVNAVIWEGLTADLAKKYGSKFILRGVRSVSDFEYERNMADVNRRIAGLETVILFAEPELAAVSSSVVRELRAFGHDISPYIPHKDDSL
ncbi:MAG: pantetheine-phosphate adenylyltransferase [Muribaculaceae bacterium]|nr:pantetheine-phosphate adenylyltransferase [Muribaculaceae bacterium]